MTAGWRQRESQSVSQSGRQAGRQAGRHTYIYVVVEIAAHAIKMQVGVTLRSRRYAFDHKITVWRRCGPRKSDDAIVVRICADGYRRTDARVKLPFNEKMCDQVTCATRTSQVSMMN